MKKKIILLMMCILGLAGLLKAQETITVGERTGNKSFLPTDCYYKYSFTQQIYTASEIGTGAGTITKIAFNQESANTYTRNLTIYMLNTDKETFDSNKDLVEVTESDIVFNGDITTTTNMSWLEIELDNEFNYEGGNILLCVQDNTGTDYTSFYFSTYDATDRAIQIRRDTNPLNYDIINSGNLSPNLLDFVNQIQLTIESGGSGPITPAPKNVVASKEELFVGDYTTISWNAIENNEYLYGYNVYFTDGTIINGEEYVTKVNNYIISPEKTSYVLATLSYNMDHGYIVVVRAVYEIDGQYSESKDSKAVTVKVSGNGSMAGVVYDHDGVTPLSGATVSVVGEDEFGTELSYSYVTTEECTFGEDMPAGNYTVTVTKDEYKVYTEEVAVEYNKTKTVNVHMRYTYEPVAAVNAESDVDIVYVDWAWSDTKSETENFESGELGNAWTTNLEYHPWTITEQKKYDGSYSMKSGGKGVADVVSDISIMVNVPADNLVMSFYHKISSETSWDKGFFYIDGVQMNIISGEVDWTYAEYPVTKGYHTFKWSYTKDGSGNSGEDTYYVDNITFYKAKSPEGIDSYSLYRKEKTSEDAVLVASNIKSESYQDDMSELEDGLYQYGVEVYYEGETSLEPYFEEGFEGGAMPTGWTTYTNSSYSEYNWDVLSTCQGYNPSSGSYAAYSNTNKLGSTASQTWLFYMITPQITVSDENSVLSFEYITPDYYNNGNNTYVNTLSVKISQSAEGPWTDLWPTPTTKASQLTWKNIQLPLKAYNGQEIYIAFVTNRYYSPCSGIDNVIVAKPMEATSNHSIITWSNEVAKGNTFVADGEWSVAENWSKGTVPTENDLVIIDAAATVDAAATAKHVYINDGASLTVDENGSLAVSGNFVNEDVDAFVINDGGQVMQSNDNVAATFKMTVVSPTSWEESHAEGWQFIASPIRDINVANFDPQYYEYDLFKYDGTQEGSEWFNYKGHVEDFETTFQQGRGYIASYELTTVVKFAGILNNETSFSFSDVNAYEEGSYANFYLLGNPFTFNMDWNKVNAQGVYDGFATVNRNGSYAYHNNTESVPVGDGFFVLAIDENPSLAYNMSKGQRDRKEDVKSINVIASGRNGDDNVILTFAGKEEEGFTKLDNFNKKISEIYVSENGSSYAIKSFDENTTEIELAFEAKEMGNYTIAIEPNGKFQGVTLVDRFTGIETNMLLEDYKFSATSSDNPNRFIVRLDNGQESTDNSQFVYQSNEELVVEAEGTVQIIDVMGRVVYNNEVVSDNNRIDVSSFINGTYIVRVINETGVKVEKVVIY